MDKYKKFAVMHFYCATLIGGRAKFDVSCLIQNKSTFDPSSNGWQMFLTKLEWGQFINKITRKLLKLMPSVTRVKYTCNNVFPHIQYFFYHISLV